MVSNQNVAILRVNDLNDDINCGIKQTNHNSSKQTNAILVQMNDLRV